MKFKITFILVFSFVCFSTSAQVPPNDLISGAIDIDQFAQPYTDAAVNFPEATSETEPTTDCNLSNGAPPFIWYKFTASLDGEVSINYSDVGGAPGAPVYISSAGETAGAPDLVFDTGNGDNTCGPTNSTTVATVAGTTYYIAVTSTTVIDVIIDASTSVLSVGDYNLADSISFANPVQGDLTLNFSRNLGETIVQIFNVAGQKVTSHNGIASGQMIVGTAGLKAGIYFAMVSNEEGSTTLKFIQK